MPESGHHAVTLLREVDDAGTREGKRRVAKTALVHIPERPTGLQRTDGSGDITEECRRVDDAVGQDADSRGRGVERPGAIGGGRLDQFTHRIDVLEHVTHVLS